MKALGWGVLAEIPDREILVGAVTQPWKADVVMRALPPDSFAAFDEPGYVKIVWTLRADPAGPSASVFSTETRVVATDTAARARFRWYWSFLSGDDADSLGVAVAAEAGGRARADEGGTVSGRRAR